MFKIFKRCGLFVLKVFGVCLLVLFFILFWQETLKILKQRRFPLPSGKKKRQKELWDEFFELQKQRFYQRQEELREEFSARIKQKRNQTKRKDTI